MTLREGTQPTRVVAAAVRTEDGLIHFVPAPARHHEMVQALSTVLTSGLIAARGEQGFVLSDGTFASRPKAALVAIAAGQIAALRWPPNLYSEDLW